MQKPGTPSHTECEILRWLRFEEAVADTPRDQCRENTGLCAAVPECARDREYRKCGKGLRKTIVQKRICQNEGILDASGLDGMQAKRLLEEISALRKALESHHSISKDPKHRSSGDRVR